MARLKSLSIEHFRGFYERQILEFAVPNGNSASGLTVIVGPNNSGKSTILEVIKKFANISPQFRESERRKNSNVKLVIENDNKEQKVIETYGGSNANYTGTDVYPTTNNFYVISARKYWVPFFSPHPLDRSSYRQQSFGIGRTGEDSTFGQRIMDIEKDSVKKEKFNSIMEELIPNFKSWVLDLNDAFQNYIKYTTGTGDTHHSEFWGDGIISLFKIVAAIVEKDTQEALVIDEPELSLHPQLQKRLAVALARNTQEKQIILITHSPYFVRWEDIKNGAKIVRLNKKNDKQCEAFSLKSDAAYYNELVKLSEDWQKPQLLDAVAKELFFAENIIFTEGQEDVGLLNKFINKKGFKINFDFFGYGTGGAGNIPIFLSMAKNLGINAGAVFDGNQTSLKNDTESKFPEFCIRQISTEDIRDKYNEKGDLIKKGLFDKDGNIKAGSEPELEAIINDLINHFKQDVKKTN